VRQADSYIATFRANVRICRRPSAPSSQRSCRCAHLDASPSPRSHRGITACPVTGVRVLSSLDFCDGCSQAVKPRLLPNDQRHADPLSGRNVVVTAAQVAAEVGEKDLELVLQPVLVCAGRQWLGGRQRTGMPPQVGVIEEVFEHPGVRSPRNSKPQLPLHAVPGELGQAASSSAGSGHTVNKPNGCRPSSMSSFQSRSASSCLHWEAVSKNTSHTGRGPSKLGRPGCCSTPEMLP